MLEKQLKTIEQLKHILDNVISEEDYLSRMPYIKENFKKVLNLVSNNRTWTFDGLEYMLLEYCNLKKYIGD